MRLCETQKKTNACPKDHDVTSDRAQDDNVNTATSRICEDEDGDDEDPMKSSFIVVALIVPSSEVWYIFTIHVFPKRLSFDVHN